MKVQNGQPVKFKKDTFSTIVCCDCHLVHRIVFNKDVTMYAYRDDWATKKGKHGSSRK
jgi:hypothetical protein